MRSAAVDWHCEETAKLRMGYIGESAKPVVTGTFPAEIRRVPVMGFSPKRFNTEVRLWVNLDELPDFFPEQNITLHGERDLFGVKDGWRINPAKCVQGAKDSEVVLWLDDV
jgi:hypothetical protein